MGSILGNRITDDSIVFQVDFSNKRSFSPNLLNYSVWATGNTSIAASSSVWGNSQYNLNGTGAENSRIIDTDPFGFTQSVIWSSTNADDGLSGDGGWDGGKFPIDPSKMYRFSVWTKRSVFGAGTASSGSFYLGLMSYSSTETSQAINAISGGAPTSNPYFLITPNSTNISSINPPYLGGLDTWTLVVGHVWPYNTPVGMQFGATYGHPDSGKYTRSGGRIGWGVEDWIWNQNTAKTGLRTYLYYSNDLASTQKFAYPRVDLVDGSEPTIAELLTGTEPVHDISPNGNVIYPINVSNYSTLHAPTGAMSFDRRTTNGTPIIAGSIGGTFSALSISIWFKPDSDIGAATSGHTLLTLQSPGETNVPFAIYIGYYTDLLTNEIVSISDKTGATLRATYLNATQLPGGVISSSSWHNITISWESSYFKIYYDGVLMPVSFLNSGCQPIYSVNYVSIGGRVYSDLGYNVTNFAGQIGAVTCWSRSLTEEEIAGDYSAQKRKYGII